MGTKTDPETMVVERRNPFMSERVGEQLPAQSTVENSEILNVCYMFWGWGTENAKVPFWMYKWNQDKVGYRNKIP
ncbi:hypothetical protein QJS10_CPB15g00024 [Acorus calamus]|uniref:Uncharacterized protein n=1 Tax=Acorus calamus TaxID=4465 RepID=A0AAV9D4Z5_ACOCL|nr:hypothetical protein QJS10_CPB15g00024 [Acorus calamus]